MAQSGQSNDCVPRRIENKKDSRTDGNLFIAQISLFCKLASQVGLHEPPDIFLWQAFA